MSLADEIMNYVSNTPNNTNPRILKESLNQLAGPTQDLHIINIAYYPDNDTENQYCYRAYYRNDDEDESAYFDFFVNKPEESGGNEVVYLTRRWDSSNSYYYLTDKNNNALTGVQVGELLDSKKIVYILATDNGDYNNLECYSLAGFGLESVTWEKVATNGLLRQMIYVNTTSDSTNCLSGAGTGFPDQIIGWVANWDDNSQYFVLDYSYGSLQNAYRWNDRKPIIVGYTKQWQTGAADPIDHIQSGLLFITSIEEYGPAGYALDGNYPTSITVTATDGINLYSGTGENNDTITLTKVNNS